MLLTLELLCFVGWAKEHSDVPTIGEWWAPAHETMWKILCRCFARFAHPTSANIEISRQKCKEVLNMISAFIYGVILAFGLIIPLGAQNIFVFNQGATQQHFLHALPSVLTAFICDAILILLAVLGVSLIVLTIPWLKIIIFIFGAIFLFYMGWVTWNSSTTNSQDNIQPLSAKAQIGFSLSVSLLNPHALLDSVGVIGTNAVHFTGQSKLAYTVACILISLCWFLFLSIAGHFLNKFDTTGSSIRIINKISAIIMWGIAFYLVYLLFIS